MWYGGHCKTLFPGHLRKSARNGLVDWIQARGGAPDRRLTSLICEIPYIDAFPGVLEWMNWFGKRTRGLPLSGSGVRDDSRPLR